MQMANFALCCCLSLIPSSSTKMLTARAEECVHLFFYSSCTSGSSGSVASSPAAIWHRWINAVLLSLLIVWWRDRRCLQNKTKGGEKLMKLTGDYCQGAVIACQKLIDFDWRWGEKDFAEQQSHLQSRHRKGSSLPPDCLHKQCRAVRVLGTKRQGYYRQVWFAYWFELNWTASLQLIHQKSFWPGSLLWVMSVGCFWGSSKWAWSELSQGKKSLRLLLQEY